MHPCTVEEMIRERPGLHPIVFAFTERKPVKKSAGFFVSMYHTIRFKSFTFKILKRKNTEIISVLKTKLISTSK